MSAFNNIEITAILDKHDQVLKKADDELYRKIVIKNKNGKTRVLHEPCKELKALQYELLPLIKRFEISKYVGAYEQGCSIKANAQIHIKAKHILHLDIKDFFPSITRSLFESVFCDGLDYKLCDRIWKALSINGGLPVGAPTSPFIANRLLFKMDRELGKLAGFFKKYTRYADDLIFSSKKRIDEGFKDKAENILREYGFKANPKKTYFMSYRKQVSGIIINQKSLSLGTGYKKRLKSDVYKLLVKNEGKKQIVIGKLSFLKHIEPNYYSIIERKYKRLDAKRLLFR